MGPFAVGGEVGEPEVGNLTGQCPSLGGKQKKVEDCKKDLHVKINISILCYIQDFGIRRVNSCLKKIIGRCLPDSSED